MIQLNVFTCLTGSRSLILHDLGRGSRGGIAPHLPPTTPHFPPLPPPTKFVWRQIEAIRHHIPLHRNFVWCQIEAIRHHIPLHENSVWCRIASIWHHTNIWGGEGWRGMWCRIAFSLCLSVYQFWKQISRDENHSLEHHMQGCYFALNP